MQLFEIIGRMDVRSRPQTQICTSVQHYYICCNSITLSRSGFEISSSDLAYGLLTSAISPNLLALEYVVTDLEVEEYAIHLLTQPKMWHCCCNKEDY